MVIIVNLIIAQWHFYIEIVQELKSCLFLEACFDLISFSSLHLKIQIMGGKITEDLIQSLILITRNKSGYLTKFAQKMPLSNY